MPTYDYRCPNGHEFERFFRKISDATGELACPVCGAVAERRVSGGAGLVFKGSGFYLTDYGKNAHRKTGTDSAKPSGDSASSTSDAGSKSESKPASDSKGGGSSGGGSSGSGSSGGGSSSSGGKSGGE
jgi:putative FmdB family regulatory protein